MAINMELLGPTPEEEEDFAIEALVFSTQIALQKAMKRNGFSKKALAKKLDMSPARVSQIFATKGANLTVKTIARIAHALGEDFEFVARQEGARPPADNNAADFMKFFAFGAPRKGQWKERVANSTTPGKYEMVA